jgi:purine-binding chemotaxis protein CheW
METAVASRVAGERVVCFAVGDEEYAVPAARVREVERYATPTRVASLPLAVRGVAGLRRGSVPVIDLAVRVGRAPSPVGPRTCIVVVDASLEGTPAVVGIVADEMRRVAALGAADVEPLPALGARARGDFISGLARFDRRLVPIVDVDRLVETIDEVGEGAALEATGDADAQGARGAGDAPGDGSAAGAALEATAGTDGTEVAPAGAPSGEAASAVDATPAAEVLP